MKAERRQAQQEKNSKKSKKAIVIGAISGVLILAIVFVFVFLPILTEKNKVMANCHGVEIRESTYRMYVYEAMQEFMTTFEVDEYTKNFWDVELEGKLPEEHIKENALNKLKLYAYYKSGCEANNIGLSDEAYQNFMDYYADYYQNYDTITNFGVEKQYFLDYLYEMYQFGVYFSQEAEKLEVTEEELNAAFDENREDAARVTVKTVFLQMENENWDALKDRAYVIKEQIQNGTSIDTFIAQESDFKGNNAGEFVVVSTSSYSNSLGDEYISAVLHGNAGEVTVLKTSTGYCVNEILKVEMKDSAKEELTVLIQEEKYTEQVADFLENSSEYTVEVTNQNIYDAVSLPGFDAEPEASPTAER